MKKLMLRTLVAVLVLQVLFFGSPSVVRAQDTTCPEHTGVSIDIKPGSDLNKINLSARGLLPVAVLTTTTFDASQFMPEMAHLSDANTPMSTGCVHVLPHWKLDDVNGDGYLDLVFFFKIQELELTSSTTLARLMAHGSYGPTVMHIEGTDSVKVKP